MKGISMFSVAAVLAVGATALPSQTFAQSFAPGGCYGGSCYGSPVNGSTAYYSSPSYYGSGVVTPISNTSSYSASCPGGYCPTNGGYYAPSSGYSTPAGWWGSSYSTPSYTVPAVNPQYLPAYRTPYVAPASYPAGYVPTITPYNPASTGSYSYPSSPSQYRPTSVPSSVPSGMPSPFYN